MKLIATVGEDKVELNLKFVENRPLVMMDDSFYNRTTIIDHTKCTQFCVPGETIEYSVKGEPDSSVINIITVPNYFTKGKMDLIYIKEHKILALIPNVVETIHYNAGVLDLECISIGGTITSDTRYPNLSVQHTSKSIIELGDDFTGLDPKFHVNNIAGCSKSNSANPPLQTDYFADGSGEIMLGESTPVMTIRLNTTTKLTPVDENGDPLPEEITPVPAFKNSSYPASLLYSNGIDKYSLKHFDNMHIHSEYFIILG